MTIEEHAETFAGRPVRDYDPAEGLQEPAGTIYRLRVEYDGAESGETMIGLIARFLEEPEAGRVPGLVIGSWEEVYEDNGSSEPIVEALVAARETLAGLRALFLGDITREESEISWITQSDVTPLLDAYPALEHFRVRGGTGLVLGSLRHEDLRSLVVESGGLGAEVVRAVAAADLPRLEHLELWLGDPGYGGDATVADLAPILDGGRFPALRQLGLRDSAIADEVAAAVARAPILGRIKVLDLSLGNLGDAGAQALLEGPDVARLERLDIHHHYVSATLVDRLAALGVDLNADDRREPNEYGGETYRYIAVSE
jgi:hypothetical protein